MLNKRLRAQDVYKLLSSPRPILRTKCQQQRQPSCFLALVDPNTISLFSLSETRETESLEKCSTPARLKTTKPAKHPGKLRPREHVGICKVSGLIRKIKMHPVFTTKGKEKGEQQQQPQQCRIIADMSDVSSCSTWAAKAESRSF